MFDDGRRKGVTIDGTIPVRVFCVGIQPVARVCSIDSFEEGFVPTHRKDRICLSELKLVFMFRDRVMKNSYSMIGESVCFGETFGMKSVVCRQMKKNRWWRSMKRKKVP